MRGGAHGFLIGRRVGAQRVLEAVAELRQHDFRHVGRRLRHKINADALGADQPHHLLDLVDQLLRRVAEEQVRFIEEEDELGLIRIADFRQLFPQARSSARAGTPSRGAGFAPAVRTASTWIVPLPSGRVRQQFFELERGFAEEAVGAVHFQLQHLRCSAAIDWRRDQAVLFADVLGVLET